MILITINQISVESSALYETFSYLEVRTILSFTKQNEFILSTDVHLYFRGYN